MLMPCAPNEWTIRELLKHAEQGRLAQVKGGHFEPARPYGLFGLRNRLRLAWMVFSGEADALRWPLQNPRAY